MEEKKSDRKPTGEQEPQPEVNIDLGFGGLFKGLGGFIDLLSGMVETAEQLESTKSGEFRIKGLGDKGRGVYGFSVRSGIGGTPKVEHFGNIRSTEEGPVVADIREPLVDVFDEAEEIVVVAELPGVGEEEIAVDLAEDILRLETTGERKYAKEILLERPVAAETMRQVYNNGILEIRLRKAG